MVPGNQLSLVSAVDVVGSDVSDVYIVGVSCGMVWVYSVIYAIDHHPVLGVLYLVHHALSHVYLARCLLIWSLLGFWHLFGPLLVMDL